MKPRFVICRLAVKRTPYGHGSTLGILVYRDSVHRPPIRLTDTDNICQMSSKPPWAAVIFTSKESLSDLLKTVDATLVAAAGCASVHVMVNGNTLLANELAKAFGARSTVPSGHTPMKIWSIPYGDKANAWNRYVHDIWDGESIAFFVDGYARPNPDALRLLGDSVHANPRAWGGSGVPSVGRSAKALRQNLIVNTGFHGNLCCIKGQVLLQMRTQNVRLPIGIYRTDSLMGAFLCLSLDPAHNVWDDSRIQVDPRASWSFDALRIWHPKDIFTHLKRLARQARGRLEIKAFSDHLEGRQQSPQSLPATGRELVFEWVRCSPAQIKSLYKNRPLTWFAMRSLRKPSNEIPSSLSADLIWARD